MCILLIIITQMFVKRGTVVVVWKYLVSHIGRYYLIKVETELCTRYVKTWRERMSMSLHTLYTVLKIGQMSGYFYTPHPHV